MNKSKMLLVSTLVIGLPMFPQPGNSQGSMIWSQSISNSFDSANIFNQANFWLDYGNSNPPTGDFEPLFKQIYFGTNDVGRTFTIASTADDPHFTAVVNELTNGIDQTMAFFLGAGNSTNGVGAIN